MSGAVCTPINTFSEADATDSLPAKLLEDGHETWGILYSIEPVGDGLIVAVFGHQRPVLLPEELFDQLQGMIGQHAVVVRDGLDFGVGKIPLMIPPQGSVPIGGRS